MRISRDMRFEKGTRYIQLERELSGYYNHRLFEFEKNTLFEWYECDWNNDDDIYPEYGVWVNDFYYHNSREFITYSDFESCVYELKECETEMYFIDHKTKTKSKVLMIVFYKDEEVVITKCDNDNKNLSVEDVYSIDAGVIIKK